MTLLCNQPLLTPPTRTCNQPARFESYFKNARGMVYIELRCGLHAKTGHDIFLRSVGVAEPAQQERLTKKRRNTDAG
jgi:hypothetical protein